MLEKRLAEDLQILWDEIQGYIINHKIDQYFQDALLQEFACAYANHPCPEVWVIKNGSETDNTQLVEDLINGKITLSPLYE